MGIVNDDMLRASIKSEGDARQLWNDSADVRREFFNFETFRAYLRHALALTIPDTGTPSGTGFLSRDEPVSETLRRIRVDRVMADAVQKLDQTGYPDEVLRQMILSLRRSLRGPRRSKRNSSVASMGSVTTARVLRRGPVTTGVTN